MASTQIALYSRLVRVDPIVRAAGFTVCGWAKWGAVPTTYSTLTSVGVDVEEDILSTESGPQIGVQRGGTYNFSFAGTGYDATTDWIWFSISWLGATATVRISTDSLTITDQMTCDIDPAFATGQIMFANNTFNEAFEGQMQYLRAWDAALSGAEALAELRSLSPVRTDNLWGSWTLSDQSSDATRLQDTSGNERNLTLLFGSLSAGSEDAPVVPMQDTCALLFGAD